MKARHIKKLRKVVANFKELVETSWNWGRFRVEDTRGYVRYFM